jgi:hypothetical protein
MHGDVQVVVPFQVSVVDPFPNWLFTHARFKFWDGTAHGEHATPPHPQPPISQASKQAMVQQLWEIALKVPSGFWPSMIVFVTTVADCIWL